MRLNLDRDSPVPLYHQISERLRYLMATGELRAGDRLPPVRGAARAWDVNLHTVRKAYQQLANLGLVEMRRAVGTVISGVAGEGAGRSRTAERLPRRSRRVVVVECSTSQCADLAEQLEARYEVIAEPWSLERADQPPSGQLVATWFHYNDIRLRWPERFEAVRFVSIAPERELAERIRERFGGDPGTTWVLDPDVTMAESIAADLRRRMPWRVEARELGSSAADTAPRDDRTALLFSPRAWAAVPTSWRADNRSFEVRYVFDSRELARVAAELGWSAHWTVPLGALA